MGRRFNRPTLFYFVILPLFILANLALGLFNLSQLVGPRSDWLLLAGGSFSLVLGGFTAGAVWSRFYWRGVMNRQVQTWRHVVDALFGWIEELPLSTDALRRLKSNIDRSLPS